MRLAYAHSIVLSFLLDGATDSATGTGGIPVDQTAGHMTVTPPGDAEEMTAGLDSDYIYTPPPGPPGQATLKTINQYSLLFLTSQQRYLLCCFKLSKVFIMSLHLRLMPNVCVKQSKMNVYDSITLSITICDS